MGIYPVPVQVRPEAPQSYYAGVAQLVERQPSKLNVASSTLVSRSIIYEPLAQSVEHMTFNHGVTGSIPVWLTTSQHNKPYVPVAQLDRATAF